MTAPYELFFRKPECLWETFQHFLRSKDLVGAGDNDDRRKIDDIRPSPLSITVGIGLKFCNYQNSLGLAPFQKL